MNELNISAKVGSLYYHLLKLRINKDELFVHFISPYRGNVKASDKEKVYEMKLPDHVSFHKDGKVHITYKGKNSRTDLVKFKESILTQNVNYTDMALLLVSYYCDGFKEFEDFFKTTDIPNDSHSIIIPDKKSFSVLISINDALGGTDVFRNVEVRYINKVQQLPRPYANLDIEEDVVSPLQVQFLPTTILMNNLIDQ
ncbi:hypothetical protein KEM09_12505 [Carboxylicivirga mesophila]|uniref:Uncharacterized protein n=1 Tax=Carboxylicivirga mesophila TaxID=1166478 RepID=A0ABS5KBB9_9BACT|nr:hypothetical protein [Carboxylicivirga mesophila]MBS2212231.1 hypothetical protein [Carboxylicivirga mesophila]